MLLVAGAYRDFLKRQNEFDPQIFLNAAMTG
jgi:hypothetical protein